MAARKRTLAAFAAGALVVPLSPVASPAFAAHIDLRDKSTACPPGAVAPNQYGDVPEANPFSLGINCVSEYGIATGFPDGNYHPAQFVTRRQMAQFVYRMALAAGARFGDAPTTDPGFVDDDGLTGEAREAVWGLVNAGVLRGTTSTTFNPNGNVTRAQMATFLAQIARALEVAGFARTAEDFFDDDDAGTPNETPHEANINTIAAEGLTAGRGGDRRYDPFSFVPREQMGEFLARMLDILVEQRFLAPIAPPAAPVLSVTDPSTDPGSIQVTIAEIGTGESVEVFYATEPAAATTPDYADNPGQFTSAGTFTATDDEDENAAGVQLVIDVDPVTTGEREFSVAAVRTTADGRFSAPDEVDNVTVPAVVPPAAPTLNVAGTDATSISVTIGGVAAGAGVELWFAEEDPGASTPDYDTSRDEDFVLIPAVDAQDEDPAAEGIQYTIEVGPAEADREFSVAATQVVNGVRSDEIEVDNVAVPATDLTAPTAIDARVANNEDSLLTFENGDSFTVVFSEPIAAPTVDDTIRVEDADGTVVEIVAVGTPTTSNMELNAAAQNVGGTDYEPGRVLTVTFTDLNEVIVPGGEAGLAIPAAIIVQAGTADAAGNAWDLAASTDLDIDTEGGV